MGLPVPSELLAALERGTLVVTGNDRAARTLRLAWDTRQHDLGHRTWQPATVLSWKAWTHGLWQRLLLQGKATHLLLTPLQEQTVWAAILDQDTELPSLRGVEDLAALAAEAWRRLSSFLGEDRFRRAAAGLSGDPASFLRWTIAFEDRCARDLLLSGSNLESSLARAVADGLLDVPAQEILVGLDRLTPAEALFTDRLREAGAPITLLPPPAPAACTLVTAATEAEELRGCARWLRNSLAADPAASLAVIVAGLESERDTIASVFREVLAPTLEDITTHSDTLPFEFSLGRALDHEPLIRAALALLRWAAAALPLEDVSTLLLSPFFAASDQAELRARAEFDAKTLRRDLRLRPETSLEDLSHLLERSPRLPLLSATIARMAAAQARFDLRSRSFGEWAEWVRTWLALAHWGETFLGTSSREFQVRERWETALDDLATLDFAGSLVSLPAALAALERLARDTVFAPAAQLAPIQIMGPREAAGSRFDAIWILRAGEFSWPPGASPHPLLPWFLQHDLGMPGCDPATERAAAARLTSRLAASADTVLFSVAAATAEGGHQRAAAVVRDLPLTEVSLPAFLPEDPPSPLVQLEQLEDAATLPRLPGTLHRGGAHLLELQAACGFRAFAEMRLGSRKLDERSLGLNAGERGSVVHDALETFWGQVESQRELRAMTSQARAGILADAIAHGLRRAASRSRTAWDAAYLEAQTARLTRLLNDWLDLELGRPEFIVQAQEKQQPLQVGPLQLSLRVDRVDLVDDRQVILDYKTGTAETSEWLGERPDKPQVPLYALLATGSSEGPAAPPPLGAVGFAELRSGKDMKLRGFEAHTGLLPPRGPRSRPPKMDAETFDDQVLRWREVLEALATDFVNGDARVRPKQFPTTCTHCGQRLLCRVDAALFEEILEEELEDTDEASDG